MDLATAQRRFPPIWVIYEHPLDYPQHFVVRVSYGLAQEREVALLDTLESARRHIVTQGGSWNLGRFPEDDPVIRECWI